MAKATSSGSSGDRSRAHGSSGGRRRGWRWRRSRAEALRNPTSVR